MFRHVALLRWQPDAPAHARAVAVEAIRALPSTIDVIRAYSVGTDGGETEGNFDVAIVADFDDADAYVVYRDHPSHRRVIDEVVRPILAARTAVQHPLPPTI